MHDKFINFLIHEYIKIKLFLKIKLKILYFGVENWTNVRSKSPSP